MGHGILEPSSGIVKPQRERRGKSKRKRGAQRLHLIRPRQNRPRQSVSWFPFPSLACTCTTLTGDGLGKPGTQTVLKIAELEAKVAQLSKDSRTSSKPPSSDIVKPQQERRGKSKRKRGAQRLHLIRPRQSVSWFPFPSLACTCTTLTGYGSGKPALASG